MGKQSLFVEGDIIMISAEVLAHEKELEENLQALSNRNRKS